MLVTGLQYQNSLILNRLRSYGELRHFLTPSLFAFQFQPSHLPQPLLQLDPVFQSHEGGKETAQCSQQNNNRFWLITNANATPKKYTRTISLSENSSVSLTLFVFRSGRKVRQCARRSILINRGLAELGEMLCRKCVLWISIHNEYNSL